MAKQPKIRFKGFTEEWEDQRLGDIGKAISGIGFPEDCQGGRQGVPFYKVSDLSNVGNEFVITENLITCFIDKLNFFANSKSLVSCAGTAIIAPVPYVIST